MDSEIMASPVSSFCMVATAPGGGGNESEGSPSEEKMASPPASSAVCSNADDDAMVELCFGRYVVHRRDGMVCSVVGR